MPGPPRPLLVGLTWGVALVLLAAIVVLGVVSPEQLEGQAAPSPATSLVGLVAITAQAAVLAASLVRRRVPVATALVTVCAVVPLAAAAGLGAATGATTVPALVAAYAVVVETAGPRALRPLVVAGLLLALGEVVRAARGEGLTPTSAGLALVQGASGVAVAAAVGVVVAARRDMTAARAEQLRATAGEQVALTQAAVARQRTVMARELHDIAAHHLSGIAVMTAALDRQIDTDPAGAKVAVRQVRQQSTAMLHDLRNLVVLLREDDPDGSQSPSGSAVGSTVGSPVEPETLDGVRRLADDARAAGREVSLEVRGAEVDRLAEQRIGPLGQLAAYRTVQESLANAARHAPGAPCLVLVDASGPDELVLTVHNDPPAVAPTPRAGGGFGIVGMRERAALTDARLSTGPTADGGFTVTLALPLAAQEVTP